MPRKLALGFATLLLAGLTVGAPGQTERPNAAFSHAAEIPGQFKASTNSFDYVKRDVMIPMRDGVKLHTVILVPRGPKTDMPILLTRTPYGAAQRSSRNQSPHMQAVLPAGDDIVSNAGYVRVFQDVRGKYGSEGEYVMSRPLRGPLNPTNVDHSTDTYDSIDWLLKNVPENNGRVGMIGTSYDGFLVLMGLVDPHPALKAAVPVNPMVDGWIGDDWFHNGAFRQEMMSYIYDQEASRGSDIHWWSRGYDDYNIFLDAGSAGRFGREMGMQQLGFWQRLTEHPAYDSFWQGQAVDKILGRTPLKVPTLYVAGLWDQEDIYGATATYKATEPKDRNNDMNFLAIGPWRHGGSSGDGSSLGPLKFDGDTALYFRRSVLLPFLNEHLKEGSPKANTPAVLAYETGSNVWRRYDSWPLSCEVDCAQKMRPLYLEAGFGLAFERPREQAPLYDEYVSDPAKPVPYRLRPIRPMYSQGSTWGRWLVDDQRVFSDRPDVLSYQSEVLEHPIAIAGRPIADLFASTSGSDSDWILKLIDVYPDEYPPQPELGGYQLMISADIQRGRYCVDPAKPSPIPPGRVEHYRLALPTANHVFLPGHRIMVQIQSSWFPLYDRNPQSFVENIFWAKPEDFRKATQRIYHAGAEASSIELPLVTR